METSSICAHRRVRHVTKRVTVTMPRASKQTPMSVEWLDSTQLSNDSEDRYAQWADWNTRLGA